MRLPSITMQYTSSIRRPCFGGPRKVPTLAKQRQIGNALECNLSLARNVRAKCVERTISDLERELGVAVREEKYDIAARLRDQLKWSREDSKIAVEDANRRFYTCFESGDIEGMERLWLDAEYVQCVHPASGLIAGKEDVMEGWNMVIGGALRGLLTITISDVRTVITGDQAMVTCIEVVDSGDNRGRVIATNVFEKKDGRWFMIHHHGSGIPPGH